MGCMAFSHGYGQIPAEKYSIEAIRNAYEHGCTFFDTAEVYSPNLSGIGHNELIVGKALKDVREGTMPMAVFTFLEKFDFSGKTILPLCTNEGSGMGSSESDIRKTAKGASVKSGLAITGSRAGDSKGQLQKWFAENGLD